MYLYSPRHTEDAFIISLNRLSWLEFKGDSGFAGFKSKMITVIGRMVEDPHTQPESGKTSRGNPFTG